MVIGGTEGGYIIVNISTNIKNIMYSLKHFILRRKGKHSKHWKNIFIMIKKSKGSKDSKVMGVQAEVRAKLPISVSGKFEIEDDLNTCHLFWEVDRYLYGVK